MKKTTTLDASAVLCFAINNFGDGQHPVATTQSLPHFIPLYVRACVIRLSRDERVKSDVRAFAKSLTFAKIEQLINESKSRVDTSLLDDEHAKKLIRSAREAINQACPWTQQIFVVRDKATMGCDFFLWSKDEETARKLLADALSDGLDVELVVDGEVL